MNAQREKRETAQVAADLVDDGMTVDRMDFPTTLVTGWSTKGSEPMTYEYTTPPFIRLTPDRCVNGRSEAVDQIAAYYLKTVAAFVS